MNYQFSLTWFKCVEQLTSIKMSNEPYLCTSHSRTRALFKPELLALLLAGGRDRSLRRRRMFTFRRRKSGVFYIGKYKRSSTAEPEGIRYKMSSL